MTSVLYPKTRVYKWYKAFEEGREVVEDLHRSGRPSTFLTDENVDKVKEMVLENQHLSLREVARDLNVSHDSIRNILHHQLGMRRVAARLVSRELNFFQKIQWKKVAEDMLDQVNLDPTFIQRIITAEHTWVSTNIYSDLPPFAIHAGHDSDGDPIYVGRAYHNGDILPAKIVPNKHQAYVAWGGEEINKQDIEVLTGHHYCWVPSGGGNVPPHALRVGQTGDGEPLYIGRGHWQGSLTPGKVHPSHGCLYIPYGGCEQKLDNYEVLVQPETWVNSSGNNIVPGTVHAGHDADGDDMYVGRAYHEGDLLPAKVVPNKGCAYVAYGGREVVKHDFELLAGYGYGWVPDANGSVPPGAVICGRTSDGEPLYIGRAHYCGSLTPGKIHPSHGRLYIPFGGQEVTLTSYEVLVRA